MTKNNQKSIFMGIAHSVIIPFVLILLTKNLFIGLLYYLIPIAAYETFASHKETGRTIFYGISLFVSFLILLAIIAFKGDF